MCEYCDYNSGDCNIFIDPLDGSWYLDITTSEWDAWNDDYVHQREYINYCPYCGRSLKEVNGLTYNLYHEMVPSIMDAIHKENNVGSCRFMADKYKIEVNFEIEKFKEH